MHVRLIGRIRTYATAGAATAAVAAAMLTGPSAAVAQPAPPQPGPAAGGCPDVEVIFARGTTEAPGVGFFGQAFVDSLRAQAGSQSIDVYPVVYPASSDFPTAATGVIDASNRIRDMVSRCPDTKLVLGGYSQGAAVMGYVTADHIPPGYIPPAGISGPMAPEIADHVAAVALFGEPSTRFLSAINAPPITIGSLYTDKTINQCALDDLVCATEGGGLFGHSQYVANGMVEQAAKFTAAKLKSDSDSSADSDDRSGVDSARPEDKPAPSPEPPATPAEPAPPAAQPAPPAPAPEPPAPLPAPAPAPPAPAPGPPAQQMGPPPGPPAPPAPQPA
jgi:cutinase